MSIQHEKGTGFARSLLWIGLAVFAIVEMPFAGEAAKPIPQAQRRVGEDIEEGIKVQEPWTFVAYGDMRSGHAIHEDSIEKILWLKPDLVLNSGDSVSDGDSHSQWRIFMDMIEPIQDAGIAYYAVMGNHELGKSRSNANFKKYFNLKSTYYAFDYKKVRFIGLDNNAEALVPFCTGSEQNEWLEEQLRTAREQGIEHIIVWFHKPPYGVMSSRKDNYKVISAFCLLFSEYQVTAVICGHDHHYYRTFRDGVTYITSAGGGAGLYDVDSSLTQIGDVWAVTHHFCYFIVNGKTITGIVYEVPSGKVIDSFALPAEKEEEEE